MQTFESVWNNIKDVFVHFHWTFVLELILLFLLVYFVAKTLKENNAKRLIAVYVVPVVLVAVLAMFCDHVGSIAFYVFLFAFSLFFLNLFNLEIRKNLWSNGVKAQQHAGKSAPRSKVESVVRADEAIKGIVKAVQSLSKANIGALIVLSNGNLPKEIVDSGVHLNSNISNQLIEGIFIPKAPLHDGAMIIYGDKIQAAGCFLPLTKRDFPKDYGTRHRAGIGITEVADVSTIIVSEETGIVSVVKRGNITRYIDSEALIKFLKEYYWKEFRSGGGR
ncbi:MAG: DNA integrity scanning protein DisA nucleotide-binding domain protein [Clostridiales bacterium]|nr:DNA integrity scanning protein DisA nucleotide-binding domain protein [Clostridiales bacterium]